MKDSQYRGNLEGTDGNFKFLLQFMRLHLSPFQPRIYRRWLNVLVLLLPLLFLGLSTNQFIRKLFDYLNQNRQIARILSVEATRIVGQEVKLAGFNFNGVLFSLTNPNFIELQGLSIAADSSPNSPPIFSADKISFRYNLAQVLDQRNPHFPFLDEISMTKPRLLLSRDLKGHWNYESILKPKKEKGRIAVGKVTLIDGDIHYTDLNLPTPKGIKQTPFFTRITQLTGIVNLRPDNSFAFDIAGSGSQEIMKDFHSVGTFNPETMHIAAHLLLNKVAPAFFTSRWVLPSQLKVSRGRIDLDMNVSYAPSTSHKKTFDIADLTGNGRLTVNNLDVSGELLYAPLESLNGKIDFNSNTLNADLRGKYAGMETALAGALFGYDSLLKQSQSKTTPQDLSSLYWEVDGSVIKADARKALALKPLKFLIAKFKQPFRKQVESMEANGDFKFHLSGSPKQPVATVSGKLSRLQYDGYLAKNVDLQANYSNLILLADVKGIYAKGRASVRTKVEFDQNGAFLVEANGRGVLLDSLGGPFKEPLGGVGDIDFAAAGRLNRTPNYTAQGTIKDLRVRGQTLKSVFAKVDTQGPDLVIRDFHVFDKKGTAQVSGTFGLKSQKIDVNLDADELNIQSLVKSFLPNSVKLNLINAIPEPEPIFSPDKLVGTGYVRGKIVGTVKNPVFNGKFFAFEVNGGRQKFDRITLNRVHLAKDAFTFSGKASRYPGEVDFKGEISQPLQPNPALSVDVSLQQQNLKHLLDLAGVDTSQLQVTGTLSTDKIAIRGNVNAPFLPNAFTINLVNASLNGLPIDNAAMTLRYRNEGIYVDNVSGEVADGLIVGSGWIPFEGGMEFNIEGTGVSLETLVESLTAEKVQADQPLVEVKGEAEFKLHLTGSLKDPVGTLETLTAKNLLINNFELGSLETKGSYAQKKFTIDFLNLLGPKPTDGVVSLSNFQYDLDTKLIQTAKGEPIRVSEMPVERIQQLAFNLIDVKNESARKFLNDLREITGNFSATAEVHGDIDHPEADVTWKTSKILALKQYEITTLTGSATVNREKLIYPALTTPEIKIHLDSPYASVDSPEDSQIKHVVIGLGQNGEITTILKPEYAGKVVPADLRVSNIDLKFLQDILNKNYSREITGQGDLGMTAVGLTHAPELQFTSNLRDVSFTPLDPTLPKISFDKIDLLPSSIKEGKIELGELSLSKKNPTTGKTEKATLIGQVDGFTFLSPFIPQDARLSVTGIVSIPLLDQIAPNILKNSQGSLTLKGDILNLGSENPSVSGTVNVVSPHLQFASLSTGLQDINGSLIFTGDRLQVQPGFKGHVQVFDKKGAALPNKASSEFVLTGSLPLGFDGNSSKGDSDGVTLKIQRLYFEESPFPGSKTGSARGVAAVDLKIIGSVKAPLITGKLALTDSSITPSSDDVAPGGKTLALPKYSLALQLGKNVNLVTSQLDARLNTEQDLFLSNSNIYGTIQLTQGTLKLPVSRFQIQQGSSINIIYPVTFGSEEILGLNVDLKARGNITATSLAGVRKRYQVTVSAKGPLTGETIDPITGRPNLTLDFETNPNDLASSQQDLTERLAGAIIGVNSLSDVNKNPAQAFAGALSGVFTGSVLPSIFDKAANTLGFEELSIGYDPIQHLTFSLSRKLVGPLYISYFQTLNEPIQKFDLKFSLRLKNRLQFSFDLDEQDTKKLLLEGVWKF